MADQAASPQTLQWQRRPDGRFQIAVNVQGQMGTQSVNVPVHVFILTQDEEDKLLAALNGVAIARVMPGGLVAVK